MFVRFRRSAYRLQVSLAETCRVEGHVRQEHVAGLGSIECEPMTIAGRVAFWLELVYSSPILPWWIAEPLGIGDGG